MFVLGMGGIFLPFNKAGMIVALALLGTAFSFREVHGDEVGPAAGGPKRCCKVGLVDPSYTLVFFWPPLNGRKYMCITGVITLYILIGILYKSMKIISSNGPPCKVLNQTLTCSP